MGESGKTAGSRRFRGAAVATWLACLATLGLGLAACGGGQSQGVTEPAGSFPVQVTTAKFPSHQVLVHSVNLQLAIKNVGQQKIPDLAVTIYTGKIKAGIKATGTGQGSFNIRLNNPALAEPNRPVWVLEEGYPKLLPPGASIREIHKQPSPGAAAAQTDTFQFGSLTQGETKNIVWHVTPVMAGTFTVHYDVAAGLQGKAKAVTANGGKVRGHFDANIASKPPETCVKGVKVVTKCGP